VANVEEPLHNKPLMVLKHFYSIPAFSWMKMILDYILFVVKWFETYNLSRCYNWWEM